MRYLTLDDVLRQVERSCWLVRDAGLLVSAVARPAASVYGQDAYPTLWLKAAALCRSLDNNQALVDGNKRLAWLTTKVFLAINGARLRASAGDGERFMLELVAGHADLSSLAEWLEAHCDTIPAPEVPDDVPR
jgi:death-on-curing protein